MSRVVAQGAAVVLRGLLFGGVLALVLIAAGTRIGPMVGHEVFVISGASMRPTIALGSAIIATRTAPEAIGAGDIVTFRGTNGVVVTHRVIETIIDQGERLYRTKGDANEGLDPFLVPQGAVIGVVRVHVPYAGYLMAMMAQPSGLLSVASAMLTCYLAMTMLEDRHPQRGSAPAAERVRRGIPA